VIREIEKGEQTRDDVQAALTPNARANDYVRWIGIQQVVGSGLDGAARLCTRTPITKARKDENTKKSSL
jgi:hypothetical protein